MQQHCRITYSKAGDNYSYRVSTSATINVLGGTATYTVSDAVVNGDSLVKLSIMAYKKYRTSCSDAEYLSKTISVYVKRKMKDPFPQSIKGAITARTDMKANGNLLIDGRDHLINSSLVPNSGVWGIWTTQDFEQTGALVVGGTNNLIDFVPSNPGNPAIIKKNQVYTGDYLDSPDKVLGGEMDFYEGAAKA
ncbi:MAG: hypothetical protein MZV64_60945 [Ignavibacteriales bacterium]|nr:hypothetical protein [Ignavibacteriales bacterium]